MAATELTVRGALRLTALFQRQRARQLGRGQRLLPNSLTARPFRLFIAHLIGGYLLQNSRRTCKGLARPRGVRTPNPQIRSLVLYPIELRAQ